MVTEGGGAIPARRLLVVIPGFGDPHVATKGQILRKNLSVLPSNTEFMVFHYGMELSLIPSDLLEHPRIEWHHQKGIIGDFLHRFVPPERVRGYTHVMLLLDDAELLHGTHLNVLDTILDSYKLDIVSPTLLDPSTTYWPFMVHQPVATAPAVRCQTVIELFCYYMRAQTYERYYKYIDPGNPWLWGMDFLLHDYFGFKMAVVNPWVIHHHFRSNNHQGGNREKMRQGESYFRRYDPTLTWERLPMLSRVLYEVPAQEVQDLLAVP